ncbi:MAG: hypothetical protein ACXWDI_12365 [Nocardioides sp.]
MTSEAAPATRRVVLHVGVPKSGTSFIQATLRANAERMREAGVLFPTQQHKGLFHAALELTGNHPGWGVPQRRVKGSWAGLCKQARAFEGTTVFSNELFSNASRAEVAAAMRELDGLEVHLVVTARDLARQLPAEWQEGIKHGRGLRFKPFLDRMLDPERSHDHAQKFWRHQDIPELLDRWGADLPPERVHLVTAPPPGAPRELLWQRFCAAVGVDPDIAEFPEVGANTSLGITAIDVLRRVNKELRGGKDNPPLLRRTVKQSLVNGALRQDRSPRVATPESLLPRLTEITDGWAKRIEAAGYDVVGDLADLTPRPAEGGAPAEHRVPVRQSRDLAVQAVAVLTREVATLRGEVQEVERLRQRVSELESGSGRVGAVVRRIRARLRND